MINNTRALFEKKRKRQSLIEKIVNKIRCPDDLDKNHPLSLAAANQNLLYKEGRVVYACVAEANPSIFHEGDDICKATVVFSEDELFDEMPNLLAEIAIKVTALRDTPDLPESCLQILDMLNGKTERKLNVKLPYELSYNKEVYVTAIYVLRQHLPKPYLKRGFFPILVLPEKTDASIILPSHYWSKDMLSEWLQD